MYTYKVAFPFKDAYFFTEFTSDMMANCIMSRLDEAFADWVYDDEKKPALKKDGRYFEDVIYHEGKKYTVTFSLYDVKKFNVYNNAEDEDGDETIVEKNIPWCMVNVVDDEGNAVYKVSDHI